LCAFTAFADVMIMISQICLRQCLNEIVEEARELYIETYVPRHNGPPLAWEFYTNFVSKNRPCIFENCLCDCSALEKWTSEYLKRKVGNKAVSVSVTPSGYADAVANDKFVLPEERKIMMKDFIDILNKPKEGNVFYIQKQNSNLTNEFPELLDDIGAEITWASEAFKSKPDAANFWMGNSKATTSLHKDPYENLYCVVKGEKTFTLFPPCDRLFLPYKIYPMGQYVYDHAKGLWNILEIDGTTPWIAIDPLNPDTKSYPQCKNARPITCTVKPGEILYLPSLWFHHVQQADQTIAVNYWYDMEFDHKYSLYQAIDKMSLLLDTMNTKL